MWIVGFYFENDFLAWKYDLSARHDVIIYESHDRCNFSASASISPKVRLLTRTRDVENIQHFLTLISCGLIIIFRDGLHLRPSRNWATLNRGKLKETFSKNLLIEWKWVINTSSSKAALEFFTMTRKTLKTQWLVGGKKASRPKWAEPKFRQEPHDKSPPAN